MVHILNRVKVRDFENWKIHFDQGGAFRKAGGSLGGRLFRNGQDRNEIFIIFDWDTLDNAKKFGQSEQLRTMQEQAGVIGKPDMFVLEAIETLKA